MPEHTKASNSSFESSLDFFALLSDSPQFCLQSLYGFRVLYTWICLHKKQKPILSSAFHTRISSSTLCFYGLCFFFIFFHSDIFDMVTLTVLLFCLLSVFSTHSFSYKECGKFTVCLFSNVSFQQTLQIPERIHRSVFSFWYKSCNTCTINLHVRLKYPIMWI